MRAYIAHGMTNRTGEELIAESLQVLQACKKYGIEALDPVFEEGVTFTKQPVVAPNDVLPALWKRDKEMIRRAHVLIDVTANRKSEGVAHELGYARYALWKPTIRVSTSYARSSGISVANLEDDLIVGSIEQAAYFAQLRWGTWWKRFIWRVTMLLRCLPKWTLYQVLEFK